MLNIKSFISLALLIPSMIAVTALEASANNGKKPVTPTAPAQSNSNGNSNANSSSSNSSNSSSNKGNSASNNGNSNANNSSSNSSNSSNNSASNNSSSSSSSSSTPKVTAPTATCQNGGVTGGLLGFTSCISGTGNDVQSGKPGEILTSQLATGVFGGITNWSLLSKVNDGETSSAFNWSGDNKGTWSVTTPLNRPFVLSLKAGTAWSAYYFANASAITQGTWDTLGVVGQKAGQDLSHASIFVAPDDNPPKPVEVPEPAGLGALGLASVLGLKKMRKRASAQQ